MPLVEFKLKDRQFPDFEFIYPPEGCWGISITDNEYVEGRLVISRMADTIYDSGNYVSKKSGIRLKARGNTSCYENGHKKRKPGYKIKLSKKAVLIEGNEIGKSKDWVLKCPESYYANLAFPYEIGKLCGLGWQPNGQFVNLVINDSYFGVYYLMEAITGDSDRADVADTGYIIENDPYWWKPDEVYFKSSHIIPQMGWTFKEPDTDDFDETSLINIQWGVATLEKSIYNNDDISKYMDLHSFAAWVLAQDILATIDAAGSNILMIKDDFIAEDPFFIKFRMGPLWDLDGSMIQDNGDFARIHNSSVFYFPELFKREDFLREYKGVWNEILPTLHQEFVANIKKIAKANPAYDEARYFEEGFGTTIHTTPVKVEIENLSQWLLQRLRNLNYLINGTYELPNPPEDPGSIFDRPDPTGDNTLLDKDGGVIKFDLMGHPVQDNAPGITITRTTRSAQKQISQQ